MMPLVHVYAAGKAKTHSPQVRRPTIELAQNIIRSGRNGGDIK